MAIYIDILIIENFIVNLFLLIITMKLLRFGYSKTIYISALIGAFYTMVLFLQNSILTSLIFKILVIFLMLIVATKSFRILNLLKGIAVFMLTSFTLAGISFAFSMMDNQYSIFKEFKLSNYSIKFLMISLMILYIFIVRVVDSLRERALVNNFIYDIEISNKQDTLLIKGLLDTGNALREPTTNLPCIIVEDNFFSHFNIQEDELFYIPYSTIGEQGSLIGFRSENIKIRTNQGEWKNVQAIVCGCTNKLSKENDFNALLSRGVI